MFCRKNRLRWAWETHNHLETNPVNDFPQARSRWAPTQEPSIRVKDLPRMLNKKTAKKNMKFFPRPRKTETVRTTCCWCRVSQSTRIFRGGLARKRPGRKETFISEDARWGKNQERSEICSAVAMFMICLGKAQRKGGLGAGAWCQSKSIFRGGLARGGPEQKGQLSAINLNEKD